MKRVRLKRVHLKNNNHQKRLHRRLLFWVIFNISFAFFPICTFLACDDYDSFTTDRSTTLSFSRDTIAFDTLLTTIPSSTQTLTVFNHADKCLRITDVWLEGGAASPFRINIDGQDMSRSADNHVTDFEVRRRDSLIVRAEVTLPACSLLAT